MDWMELLTKAIDYMEQHLLEDIDAQQIAGQVNVSAFYFQKGFKIMTGYTIGEYVRYRRLYLAALELLSGGEKIIDLSFKYGYESPESFSKAFSRFHGIAPVLLRQQPHMLRTFLPLSVQITVKGGAKLDYSVEDRPSFRVIGMERLFTYADSYGKIPKFWEEFKHTCASGEASSPSEGHSLFRGGHILPPECRGLGRYGISVEIPGDSRWFRYLIAGDYEEEPIAEGFRILEIPACTWARFRCTGPLPGAFQAVNTRVFREWLPGNGEYTAAAGINLELYTPGSPTDEHYRSELWIPVRKIHAG